MNDRIYFNGINGGNGQYAFKPRSSRGFFKNPTRDGRTFWERTLLARLLLAFLGEGVLTPMSEVNANDLGEAGWGVVFPEGRESHYKAVLGPLLALRKEQAGSRYRELTYRSGETTLAFLDRNGGGLMPVNPDKIPYYLLLVGGAQEIPFAFQFNLDIHHAVGRVAFEEMEAFGRYSATVVRQEGKQSEQILTSLFGTRHELDPPTQLSSRHLINGLADHLSNVARLQTNLRVESGLNATKMCLVELLGSRTPPNLLLTATHGVLHGPYDAKQQDFQGSLVCQDWPGPGQGRVLPEHMVSAADIEEGFQLQGMIAFLFACCSGATPERDHFPKRWQLQPKRLALKDFIARLPQKLLGLPDGCSAVIGHMDNVFMWSFTNWESEDQTELFRDFFVSLLRGDRLGHALRSFHESYALRQVIYEKQTQQANSPGITQDDKKLLHLWFSIRDIRNYFILGDPAVQLPKTAPTTDGQSGPMNP